MYRVHHVTCFSVFNIMENILALKIGNSHANMVNANKNLMRSIILIVSLETFHQNSSYRRSVAIINFIRSRNTTIALHQVFAATLKIIFTNN